MTGLAASLGPAQRLLQRLGYQYAAMGRTGVAVPAVVLGLLAAPEDGQLAMALMGGLVLGWSVVYVIQMLRGPAGWLLVGDVMVVVVACLTQPWTVAYGALVNGGNSWAVVLASMTVVVLQLHTTLVRAVLAVAVIIAALLIGTAISPVGLTFASTFASLWVIAEAALARLLWLLVRRGGAKADTLIASAEVARREATVAAARRAEDRAYAATLHDTAATTLLMVGLGEVGPDDRWLPGQAQRDLQALSASRMGSSSAVDLGALLDEVARDCGGLSVAINLSFPIRVSGAVASAVSGAVREALNNVARHAGVTQARISIAVDDRRVMLDVLDSGRGFDPDTVCATRRGIAYSITARMQETGGHGEVLSRPGHGTRVRLEWTSD